MSAASELAADGYLSKARHIVKDYVNSKQDPTALVHINDVYIVWCSKTLQNWKCLVGTNLKDGLYYEVTHNGDVHETYLDVYAKLHNVVIPD